ncbi:MAG: LLM class flavin-dependent oxidoreductase [Gammaproteobacteria bacterium]|nr:LLM class flavin-dependent oxidoreductase [Gammaproteobacteria bacterium]
MRTGVLLNAECGDEPASQAYDRLLCHVRAIEDNGFDTIWIPQAHACASEPMPSPLVMAGAIAAETRAIRIGVFVKLALEHPVKICEDVAVLDLLCHGRLLFGADPGGREQEYAGARVGWAPRLEAFREALEIVVRGWTSDGFAYLGEFYRLPRNTRAPASAGRYQAEPCVPPHRAPTERAGLPFDYLSILPKPLQIPHPPVYLVAADRETADLAARRGHSLLIPPQVESAAEVADHYWRVLEGAGRHRHEIDLAIARDVYVEIDGEQARKRVTVKTAGSLIGSPDEVLHGIKDLQHVTGLRHLLCRMQLPGLTTGQTDASIRLFAAEVRSRLQM